MVAKITYLLLAGMLQLGALQAQKLEIQGVIKDLDTNEALSFATIILQPGNRSMITDSSGFFAFKLLETGLYTVQVSHAACENVAQQINLKRNSFLEIFLPHHRNTLEEVLIVSHKLPPNFNRISGLHAKELERNSGLSLAAMLSTLNGVHMLQTGATVAKPVIHGLHGSRLLTINNGVRQEGQQWGNEHVTEIDPYIADNLMVLNGVAALQYGSDAIGGIVLVNTKPLRKLPGRYGELNTAYFTNNQQYVAGGLFEQQLTKLPAFTYRLQGTIKQAANYTTPHYRLNNTAFKEQNFSITTGWTKPAYNVELFFSRFYNASGVATAAHIGNLTDLENAIRLSRPATDFTGLQSYKIGRPSQNVTHNLLKLKGNYTYKGHIFSFQVASQQNNREEYDVLRNSNSTVPQLTLRINTFTEDINWTHPAIGLLKGTIGLAAMQQDNWFSGRYIIPHYTAHTYGAYWLESLDIRKWTLKAGIRMDHKQVHTTRLPISGPIEKHHLKFNTLAGSLYSAYKWNEQWSASLTAAFNSRAPHVNELFSAGIHHGAARFEQGDSTLQVEHSFNKTLGITFQSKDKNLLLDSRLFHHAISDFIYLQPQPDKPVITSRGAFPGFIYQQTDAVLKGVDFTAQYKYGDRWELEIKASFLQAYNKKIADWLLAMPADRFSFGLERQFQNKGAFTQSFISVDMPFVSKQRRVPDETIHGKQDYRSPDGGYALLNMHAGSNVTIGKQRIVIQVSAYNVMNTVYRDYLNSFRYYADEMGRNMSIRIKLPFGS